MVADYFRLAYSSARHRKLRSWLTMIGIFIGIAAVVALISLSQGLKDAISEQFISLGTDKLVIRAAGSSFGPPGTGVSVPLTTKDEKVIEKVRGTDVVVGRLLRTVKLEFNDEVKYSFAVSMPEENEEIQLAIEANNYNIKEGRILDKNDKFKVMIGADFADDFFEKRLEVRNKIFIQDKKFEVVGILKKSGNPQQDSTIVIPDAAFRSILAVGDQFDIIPVKILEGENIELVAENIKKELRKSRDVDEGKEDFTVETPGQLLETLTNILLVVQGVLVGIAAISLFVGAIGIMNTMYTAVIERTKEIGIMKATGARSSQISRLFLIESGFLGLFGGMIGVFLGFSISKTIEFVSFQVFESQLIQASFSPFLLFGALFFAFAVGAISGVLPARQAANLKPVDALRK